MRDAEKGEKILLQVTQFVFGGNVIRCAFGVKTKRKKNKERNSSKKADFAQNLLFLIFGPVARDRMEDRIIAIILNSLHDPSLPSSSPSRLFFNTERRISANARARLSLTPRSECDSSENEELSSGRKYRDSSDNTDLFISST